MVEEEDEDEFAAEWEEGGTEYTETSSPSSDYQLAAPHPAKILVRRRSITDLVIVSSQTLLLEVYTIADPDITLLLRMHLPRH